MADTIERLYKITVDGAAAIAQLNKIADSTGSIDKKLTAFGDTAKKLGASLLAAFGANEVIERVKTLSEQFDQIGKDAQKVGVAADQLQRLRYAAQFAGVGAEQLDKAITNLAVGMQKMNTATDATSATLKAMGVRSGDSPTVALEKIADRFANMPDGIEKTAEAVALFGKKIGVDLIPWLNGGSKSIKELTAEIDRFGGVISQDTINLAAQFNDNLTRLGKVSAGAGAQFESGLLPALTGITTALTDATKAGTGFKGWGEAVGKEMVGLAAVVILASNAFSKIAAFVQFATSTKSMSQSIVELRGRLEKLTDEGANRLQSLADSYAKAALAATGHGDAAAGAGKKQKDANDVLEDAAKKTEHLATMEKVRAVAAAELTKIKEHDIEVELQINKQTVDNAAAQDKLGTAVKATTKAYEEYLAAQEKSDLQLAAYNANLEVGTTAQREWNLAQMFGTTVVQRTLEPMQTQSEMLTKITDDFGQFADSVATGAVTAAQAFKRMVESIVADLLKMLAKKYILDFFFPGGAPGSGKTVVIEPPLVRSGMASAQSFAQGGAVTRTLAMPSALSGTTGTASSAPTFSSGGFGALGMAAAPAPAVNVTVNNNAPGVDVRTQQGSGGDLQIIIEQTRKAIASDIRRGGSDVARSLESTYRVGRGQAAPF